MFPLTRATHWNSGVLSHSQINHENLRILLPGILLSRNLHKPRETAGFRKERWLKRMGNQPLEKRVPFSIFRTKEELDLEKDEPFRYAKDALEIFWT